MKMHRSPRGLFVENLTISFILQNDQINLTVLLEYFDHRFEKYLPRATQFASAAIEGPDTCGSPISMPQ